MCPLDTWVIAVMNNQTSRLIFREFLFQWKKRRTVSLTKDSKKYDKIKIKKRTGELKGRL